MAINSTAGIKFLTAAVRVAWKNDPKPDVTCHPRPNSPYRRLSRDVVWRDARLSKVFLKLRQSIKAAKSEVVLVNWNNNDVAGMPPSWMPESLNCLNDWTNKEWWDSNDLSSVWLIKRRRGSRRSSCRHPALYVPATRP